MSEIQIRPTVASDLPRIMGMDHSVTSEYVWQLELRGTVVKSLRRSTKFACHAPFR